MMALHGAGGCFDTSHPHQKYNYHHGNHQVNLGLENWICDTGPSSSNILTGYKERRDSTDSDKENEVESLIQFPVDSNVFNYNPQQQEDLSQVCQKKILFNEESANESVRNIRESPAEEDLDLLLTDLFNEDDANAYVAEKKLESFELPQPEEIGLASIPETSDLVLSICNNSNQSEPWELSGNTKVDFKNSPFRDVDQLEDENELEGALSLCRKMEEELVGGVSDVFLGYESSSLDEDIKTALEFPASKDFDFLQDNISLDVDIGVLQEDIHQALFLPGEFEESPTKHEESKAGFVSNNKTEDEKEEDDWLGVRTRRGRKRKPGTVVDLLVSSYTRKTRCKDCGPCRAPDCGECVFCLDKPRFGGRNKKKAACLERKCLNLSLSNTKLTPAQSGLDAEDTSDTWPQSEGKTVNAEDGTAVRHDHCYSMNQELNQGLEEIDLCCHESLDEFIAETFAVQLQKKPDPSIRNILGKGCENQEELEVSGYNNLTAVQRGMISEEYKEFLKEDLKAFKGVMLKIKPIPKVKRRGRRNFK